ncbi:MAG: GNAT family N-acetyltransferase [Oscillospiraceae bacterium]|nr:GNAT family N-acetyltransferase [Oscillospiraceae bacterium]
MLKNHEISFLPLELQDLEAITKLYNSNRTFLKNHLNRQAVTAAWVEKEHFVPRTNGFVTEKVLCADKLVGLVDYKFGKETYLSLLLLDKTMQKKGLGTKIVNAFGQYTLQNKGQALRIDVVTGYEGAPLDFWRSVGFADITSSRLEWDENVLPVIVMKKFL